MKRILSAAVILLLAALTLTGCGASSQHLESPASRAIESDNGMPYPAPMQAPAAKEVAQEQVASVGQPTAEDMLETRKIIYNADMLLVVEDTEQAAQEIADMATSMGGYVATMNGYRQDDRMIYDITIRIPADKFETGRAALHNLAVRVESERVSTNDVTDEYYDIDARLRTLKATEKELTQLLEETRERGGSVDDIMKIYGELVRIRSEIESLQGQLNRLDKLVAFSTITIHLEPHILSQPIESEGWRPAEIIHNSIVTLMNALTGLATLLIQFVIVVLPLILVLALPLILVIRLIHHWQKRRLAAKEKERESQTTE